jgi:hypothetical protein
MEAFIGLAVANISIVTFFLCLIAIRGRRRRRGARTAGSHESQVPVDEAAWAEIVRQLKKQRARDEPGDSDRAR